MIKYKMNALIRDNGCNKRRNFNHSAYTKKGEQYYSAIAIKNAAKALIEGASIEDVCEEVKKAYADIPYQNVQREKLTDDAIKYLKGYIEWERRPLIAAPPCDIAVSEDMEVIVTPDFLVADGSPSDVITVVKDEKGRNKSVLVHVDGVLELIQLRTGKQTSFASVEKIKTDIGLYAMLLYARQFVKPGQKVLIKANYYFLKNNNDNLKRGIIHPFSEKNIYGIEEIYEGIPNQTDEDFEVIIDRFLNGKDEVDCDEKDCKACQLYDICKGYTEAPVSADREKVTKITSISLNANQKMAVEY